MGLVGDRCALLPDGWSGCSGRYAMRGIGPAAHPMFFVRWPPFFVAPPSKSAAASRPFPAGRGTPAASSRGEAVHRACPGGELRRRTGAGNRHFPTARSCCNTKPFRPTVVYYWIDICIMKTHNVPVGTAVHRSSPRAGPTAGTRSYGCRCACAPPGPERVVREGAPAPRDECGGTGAPVRKGSGTGWLRGRDTEAAGRASNNS